MSNKRELPDEEKQKISDYQITFSSDHGMRVLDDIQDESGYDKLIVPQGVPDVTAYALGARDLFLYIKEIINSKLDKEVQTEAESEAEDAQV